MKGMCNGSDIEEQKFSSDVELGTNKDNQVSSGRNRSIGNLANQKEEFMGLNGEDVIIEVTHIRMDTLREEDEENALME